VLTHDRQKVFDRNFGWVLLGADFASVLDGEDYSYLPAWLRESGSGDGEGLGGQSFAQWVTGVFAAMEAAVDSDQVESGLDREGDLTTATLMRDVARATYRS
jgi:hypothetical protein